MSSSRPGGCGLGTECTQRECQAWVPVTEQKVLSAITTWLPRDLHQTAQEPRWACSSSPWTGRWLPEMVLPEQGRRQLTGPRKPALRQRVSQRDSWGRDPHLGAVLPLGTSWVRAAGGGSQQQLKSRAGRAAETPAQGRKQSCHLVRGCQAHADP